MSKISANNEKGFSLVELIVVIVVFAMMASVVSGNFDTFSTWKMKSDLSKFLRTWEFLQNQASVRDNAYRLVVDIEKNEFYVRKEILEPIVSGQIKEVDFLSNLRTKGERERRRDEQKETDYTAEEQFVVEQQRRSMGISDQFYAYLFTDTNSPTRLAIPDEFPSLGEPYKFDSRIDIVDIEKNGKRIEEGSVGVRFLPKFVIEPVVIHIKWDNELDYTIAQDPGGGKLKFDSGYKEYDWAKEFSPERFLDDD